MNERSENPLAWLIAAIVMLLASAIGVQEISASFNAVDRAVPLVALALLGAAWMARGTTPSIVASACIPLLLALRFSTPEESQRLIAYGLVLASCFVLTGAAVMKDGTLGAGEALYLVLSPLALMRFLPLETGNAVSAVVALSGTALLILVLRSDSRVSIASCALAFVAGISTPISPVRASGSSWLLVAVVWWIRSPAPASGASVLAASLLAGRWSWPIAAIALAAKAFEGRWRRGDSMIALPSLFLRSVTVAPLRLLAGAPVAMEDARGVSRAVIAGALIIGVSAFAMRPGAAIVYGLAALLMLHAQNREIRNPIVALPLTVACTIAVALFAWSGAIHAHFPLPIGTRWIAAISLMAMIPLIPLARRAGGVVAAAAFVAIVAVVGVQGRAIDVQTEGISLTSGESVVVNLRTRGDHLRVVFSGANVAHLRDGELLGQLDVLDSKGHAWRREIRIGDASDWGAFRTTHSFHTNNPLPRHSGTTLTGAGTGAFLPGAGSIEIATSAQIMAVRVTANPSLPDGARLQFERIEVLR